jgi:hypothetical protein
MNTSPAHVIRAYLIGQSALSDPQLNQGGLWPGFVATKPDKPDTLVSVYNDGSRLEARSMRSGAWAGYPGIKFIARASTEAACYVKLDEILTALDVVQGGAISYSGMNYVIDNVSRVMEPTSMGEEPGTRRQLMAATVRITFG